MTAPAAWHWRALGAWLAPLVGGTPPPLGPAPEGDPFPALAALASEQGVVSALADLPTPEGLAVPAEFLAYLDGAHQLNADRSARLLEQLDELGAALNAVEVEPVPLKGAAHLLVGLYPRPGDRMMIDLDLLIPADRLEDCLDALEARGYDRPRDYFRVYQYPPIQKPGAPAQVELHRAAVANRYSMPRLVPPGSALQGATRLEVRGATWRLPTPDFRVRHALVHGQLSHLAQDAGEVSLRDLVDVARLRRDPISWERLVQAFQGAGRGPTLEAFLALQEQLLGLEAPAEVPLGPGGRVWVERWWWLRDDPRAAARARAWVERVVEPACGLGRAALRALRRPGDAWHRVRTWALGRRGMRWFE